MRNHFHFQFQCNIFIRLLAFVLWVVCLGHIISLHYFSSSRILKMFLFLISCSIKKFNIFVKSHISPLCFLLRQPFIILINISLLKNKTKQKSLLKWALIMLLTECVLILKTIACEFNQDFVFQHQNKLFSILLFFQK